MKAATEGPAQMRAMAMYSLEAKAAALAFFACGFTRWNGIFPIGGEGWELIFDPIGSALLATVAAAGLALLDGIFFSRFLSADS